MSPIFEVLNLFKYNNMIRILFLLLFTYSSFQLGAQKRYTAVKEQIGDGHGALSFVRTSFLNDQFARNTKSDVISYKQGWAARYNVVAYPFFFSADFNFETYSADGRRLGVSQKEQEVLYLAGSVSANTYLFPGLKYFVPYAGIGAQMGKLGFVKDNQNAAIESDAGVNGLDLRVGAHIFFLKRGLLGLGAEYRHAFFMFGGDKERLYGQFNVSLMLLLRD